MPRASYRIIPIDEFSYEVRVDEPNAGGRTITGFQSMAEAENGLRSRSGTNRALALGRRSEIFNAHYIPVPSRPGEAKGGAATRAAASSETTGGTCWRQGRWS